MGGGGAAAWSAEDDGVGRVSGGDGDGGADTRQRAAGRTGRRAARTVGGLERQRAMAGGGETEEGETPDGEAAGVMEEVRRRGRREGGTRAPRTRERKEEGRRGKERGEGSGSRHTCNSNKERK